jgi:hypothetical protein
MAFETINLGTQPTGTGGDTARSAFEKVNKNFITAEVLASSMSQAQFEAIRAQNNEEYAASGFVHFGKHYNLSAGFIAINEGLWTATSEANILRIGRYSTDGVGESKAQNPHVNIAGVLTELSHLSYPDSVTNRIKLPQAPDGKTTYNKSTGANTVHSTTTAAFNAAGADPTNVEVVTDRVDMWGFESWLEEVSSTNPYIYPNGLIQSLATTMDGIATSASNRPDTYYAWFDGDTSSKGKGVNYFTLTDAQKRKMLANHKNKLYFLDDGRLVQWRVRGRSFAGAGNGDWGRINSVGGGLSYSKIMGFTYGNSTSTLVSAQGAKNSVVSVGGYVGNEMYTTSNATDNPFNKKLGVFGLEGLSASVAINGECYFLVCGTVNRLNQGAYHPSFNPSGSKFWINTVSGGGAYWYLANAGNNNVSTALCFNQVEAGTTSIVGARKQSGYIGDSSARPDGRLYDAIYASGQGGVCRDLRYSANHTTLEKFAEADLKVKNGAYRGFEKGLFTFVDTGANRLVSWYNTTYYRCALSAEEASMIVGNVFSVVGGTTVLSYLVASVSSRGDGTYNINTNGTIITNFGVVDYVIISLSKYSSVGDLFIQTDVIGNPANILATPALANGWEGLWIPDLPAGGGKTHYGTRKNINLGGSPLLTSNNNGATWDSFLAGTQAASIANALTGSYATTEIRVCQYQAFAKQTEATTNDSIYGYLNGMLGVFASNYYTTDTGCLLSESLISKVLISGNIKPNVDYCTLLKPNIQANNKLSTSASWGVIGHSPITIASAATDAPAFKALGYCVKSNQQAYVNYAATELKYNGTNWGDDSQIHIVDGENTLTDLNGKTVKVVTHKLKEPIGWIKNTI